MGTVVTDQLPFFEGSEQRGRAVEVGNFDVGSSDSSRVVRVRARRHSDAIPGRHFGRLLVMQLVDDFGVERLDHVNKTVSAKPVKDGLAQS